MEPKSLGEHQKLLTDVIKKQIVILGPDITLAKARNVAGLTVADDGTVTAITGDPKAITQKLIDQFMELSGLIVKKTMEPLLASSVDGDTKKEVLDAVTAAPTVTAPIPTAQPTAATLQTPATPQPTPSVSQPAAAATNPNPPLANSNSDVKQSG
jgi:hypothetical protein